MLFGPFKVISHDVRVSTIVKKNEEIKSKNVEGRDLELRIYGVNQNGRSRPTVLDGFRLKVAELQIGNILLQGFFRPSVRIPKPLKITFFQDILCNYTFIFFCAARNLIHNVIHFLFHTSEYIVILVAYHRYNCT